MAAARSRVLTFVLLSALAGALCGVGVACAVVLWEPAGTPVARPAEPAAPARAPTATGAGTGTKTESATVTAGATTSGPREVLRRWDAAREHAWTAADPEALARLYTPGSVAGRRDVAMLRAWSSRGVRLDALTTQVLRMQVLVERERRLVLVLTDRVARAEAGGVPLPHDRASTRRVVLVRGGGAWRVTSVSPAPPVRS